MPDGIDTEEELRTYYLEDEKGVLVPVPGMRFEDFSRLYRQEQDQSPKQGLPQGVVRSMVAEGHIVEDRLELTADLELEFLSRQNTTVPLGFAEGTLEGEETVEGCGSHLLGWDQAAGGMTLSVRDPAPTVKLRLPMSFPVERRGEDGRLGFSPPRALRSRFDLRLPPGMAVVDLHDSGRLKGIRLDPNGGGVAEILDLRPPVRVDWSSQGRESASSVAFGHVRGDLRVEAVDSSTIRTEATFAFRKDDGRVWAPFTFRLPAGARITQEPSSADFVAETIPDPDLPERSALKIQPEEIAASELVIQFAVEQSLAADAESSEVAVGDFTCSAATKQVGRLTLMDRNERPVQWRQGDSLRRIEESGTGNESPRVAAVFEYFRQPLDLRIAPTPPASTVLIEPHFVLDVQQASVELQGTLICNFRGAASSELAIQMHDWTLLRVDSTELASQDSLEADEQGIVRLSFLRPLAGTHTLRLRAVRTLAAIPGKVALPTLEFPQARTFPAQVAIVAAENLTLAPDRERMSEFLPQSPPADLDIAIRERSPLCYIDRSEAGRGELVMEIGRQPRLVNATSRFRCEAQERVALITQEIDYEVRHDFLEQLRLQGPPRGNGLTWRLNDQALNARLASVEGFERAAWLIQLPRPRQGRFKLSIQQRLPLNTDGTREFDLRAPLFVPMDAELGRVDVEVASSLPWSIGIRDVAWQVEHPTEYSDWTRIGSYQGAAPLESVPLRFARPATRPSATLLCESIMHLIRLSRTERMDEVHWNLITSDSRIRFEVPNDPAPRQVLAKIDGAVGKIRSVGREVWELDIPPRAGQESIRVELFAVYPTRSAPGKQRLRLLRLAAPHWTAAARCFIELPPSERLLSSAAVRSGVDAMPSQRSDRDSSAPTHTTPRYELIDMANAEQIEFETATTARLWLRYALPGILLGWLICFVPVLRHPYFGLIASVAMIAWALMLPDSALAISASLIGGLMLGGVAVGLNHGWFSRLFWERSRTDALESAGHAARRPDPPPFAPPSSSVIAQPAAERT